MSFDPDAECLDAGLLGISMPRSMLLSTSVRNTFRRAKGQVIERWEREYVADLVRHSRGNLSLASRSAGVNRAHLYRLMKKHRIVRQE
jgi:two-component system response regulator GlrR